MYLIISGSWILNEPAYSSLHEVPSNSLSEAEDYLEYVPKDTITPLSDGNDGNSAASFSADMCLHNQTNDEGPLVDIMAKYLLKVKEENRLTQTTVEKIAKATSELFSVACRRLQRKVDETLKDANMEKLPGIDAAFEEVTAPFEQLDSKWMLPEFTRKKLPYVVCIYMVYCKYE